LLATAQHHDIHSTRLVRPTLIYRSKKQYPIQEQKKENKGKRKKTILESRTMKTKKKILFIIIIIIRSYYLSIAEM